MKNYWEQTPVLFETNEKEILKLDRAWQCDRLDELALKKNLEKVKHYFKQKNFIDVIEMTIRKVPVRRSTFDSAVLICLKLSNGKFFAKRHNNSQWLSLEYY